MALRLATIPATGPYAWHPELPIEELEKRLNAAFKMVPYTAGINNHMGSRMTAQPVAMAWLMGELQRRHKFFVDSRTSAQTVAAQQAQPDSVWQLYKLLIAQKKQRPELGTDGSYDVKQLDNGVVQISRELNGSKTLFVLNLSDSAQDISAINRDDLTSTWAFDADGNTLAAHGLLMLQSKE